MIGAAVPAAAREPARLDLQPVELHLVAAEVAARIVAPATDAMTPEERAQLVAAEPLNLAALVEDDATGDGADAGRRAGIRIRQLVDQGRFRAVGPVMAVHEMRCGAHRQLGVVADVPVVDHQRLVRPHEATRRDHEATLAAFLSAAGADLSPVTLTYRACPDIDALAAAATGGAPDLAFTGWRDVTHRVWVVRDPLTVERLRRAFAGAVEQLTVVDGHHRVAAATRLADAGGRPTTLLATLVPDRDVRLASYDRCVAVHPDVSEPSFLTTLAEVANLAPASAQPPERPVDARTVALFCGGRWYDLRLRGDHEVPAAVLLQEQVLGPLLGIDDARSHPRLAYVPGTVPLEQVATRCRERGELGFVLAPVPIDLVQRMAARGELFPSKATYSHPKPGAGVFLRLRTDQPAR